MGYYVGNIPVTESTFSMLIKSKENDLNFHYFSHFSETKGITIVQLRLRKARTVPEPKIAKDLDSDKCSILFPFSFLTLSQQPNKRVPQSGSANPI